jgi:integrase
MSAQLRSGGGGGMHSSGYEAAQLGPGGGGGGGGGAAAVRSRIRSRELGAARSRSARRRSCQLERGERPRLDDQRPKRILTLEEMQALIASADCEQYRCLLELMLATRVRIGEALGLAVGDLDREHSLIRVEYQLGRDGTRTPLKTAESQRSIDIPPQLMRRRERFLQDAQEKRSRWNPARHERRHRNWAADDRASCQGGFSTEATHNEAKQTDDRAERTGVDRRQFRAGASWSACR